MGGIFTELILICESKLKIMLSAEDMAKYSLDRNTADYDGTETRRALWCIFDDAKRKTGFDAAKGRILVQMYPAAGGGCELCVTKISQKDTDPELDFRQGSDIGHSALREVFYFSELDDLVCASEKLISAGLGENCDLLFDPEDKSGYYLIAPQNCRRILCEYAEVKTADIPMSYINEHFIAIRTGNAAKELTRLA